MKSSSKSDTISAPRGTQNQVPESTLGPVRKTTPKSDKYSEQYELFAGIADTEEARVKVKTSPGKEGYTLKDLPDEIPMMPAELVKYDYPASQAMTAVEAEAVFLIWLKSRLTGQDAFDPISDLICHDVDPDVFFPMHSLDIEDENPTELQFAIVEAINTIGIARAKSHCTPCPMRMQCLAQAIITEDTSGIWGGWGVGGRATIGAKFESMRRYYQRGLQSMSQGLRGDSYKGMPPAQIRKTEKRALAIELMR